MIAIAYGVITGFVNRSWQIGQQRLDEGTVSKRASSAEFGNTEASRGCGGSSTESKGVGVCIEEESGAEARDTRLQRREERWEVKLPCVLLLSVVHTSNVH